MFNRRMSIVLVILTVSLFLTACGATSPEIVEIEVTKIVKETVVAEGEAQVVNIEVTKIVEVENSVEVVVTATPVPISTGPKSGGSLTVAIAEDPRSLDSLHDSGTEGLYILEQVMEGLLHLTEDGEIVPELAKELPTMVDDQTYVFELREGVTFHDGTAFDADDVKWTYDTVMSEESGSNVWSWYQSYIESVEVLDTYSVQFNLKRIWPDFLDVIATRAYGYIKSEEAFTEYGEDYGTQAVIGTGPFKFVEWVRGDSITLERYDEYWDPDGVPYLDTVVYKPITEDSTRMIAFMAGDVDVLLGVPFKDADDLDAAPGINVESTQGSTIVLLLMNLRGNSIFKEKLVRQALSYGVNRNELNEVVYYGKGTVPDSVFPSWHWAHNDFPPFEYDPEKAKELLAEAGYDENNPLQFTIYTTAVTQYVDTAVLVQAQLAQIGVIAEIEQAEKSALGQKMTEPESWIDPPQVMLYRYIQQAPSAYYGWLSYSSNSEHYNDTGYNKEGAFQNPEVDEWINQADSTADRVEAKALYGLAVEALREDVPDLPLMWLPSVYVFHDYVTDLPISAYYQVPLNGVWLDK